LRIPQAALLLIVLSAALSAPPAVAETGPSIRTKPGDRCPVCGMFVSKFPSWTAAIVFADGASAVFDGPKDLFTFYHDLRSYDPSREVSSIAAISVLDYYAVAAIDGRKAYYVQGSDVSGPMGSELIPFAELAAAEEFKRDHGGKSVLTFDAVTPEVLKRLR